MITICQILYIWQHRLLYCATGSDGGTEINLSDSALIKDPKDKLPFLEGMSFNRELASISSKRLWVRGIDTHSQRYLSTSLLCYFRLLLQYISEAIFYFYTPADLSASYGYFTDLDLQIIMTYFVESYFSNNQFIKISSNLANIQHKNDPYILIHERVEQ